jgi:hypothetical protein
VERAERLYGRPEQNNLAVEHCTFQAEMFSDPCGEICKATEHVSVARDQFSFAILNVRQYSKTIDLQFKDKLVESKGSGRRESRIGRRFRSRTNGL